MPLTITWICHASTAASRAAAFPGDEPLDTFGERDCGKVRALGSADRVWTAPELRARQTAARLNLAASIEGALRDVDHGRWRGSSLEAVASEEPEGLKAWMTDPSIAPHGGESLNALFIRISSWMELRRTGDARAIAVTHPSVVRMAVAHAVGAGASAAAHIDIAPLGTAVTSWNGRWRLRALGSLLG